MHHIQPILSHIIKRPIELLWNTESSTSVFGILIQTDHPSPILITLDQPAARAFSDALATDLVNLRGTGRITNAEFGLLEFLSLMTLDKAVQFTSTSHPLARISSFLDETQIKDFLEINDYQSISLTLNIAASQGGLQLHLNSAVAQHLLQHLNQYGNLPSSPPAPTNPIQLHLALPPLSIDSSEIQSMQPGDVLMLGVSELAAAISDCRLVTSTGWSLAPVEILHDSPTVLTICCQALNPSAHPSLLPTPNGQASDSFSGRMTLQPLLASRHVTPAQLQQWQPGEIIDLTKDEYHPLILNHHDQPLARGELVRVDKELAMRLTQIHPPPQGTSP